MHLAPLVDDPAGSRFLDGGRSDMECCYKAFRRSVIDGVPLREKRFGFEPEFVQKIARRRLAIYEVPVKGVDA